MCVCVCVCACVCVCVCVCVCACVCVCVGGRAHSQPFPSVCVWGGGVFVCVDRRVLLRCVRACSNCKSYTLFYFNKFGRV